MTSSSSTVAGRNAVESASTVNNVSEAQTGSGSSKQVVAVVGGGLVSVSFLNSDNLIFNFLNCLATTSKVLGVVI